MKYLTRDELRALTNDELLKYINSYLANGGTMNSFEKYHHTTKKYIKTRLNELNVVYNQTTKKYEPIAVEETNYNEVLTMEQKLLQEEILLDIKNILLSMNSSVEVIRNNMEQVDLHPKQDTTIVDSKPISVDDIRPVKSDETMIIRNFKVYPSIANRLKKLTVDTDYQVQQVFNALLDEVLTKYGY